MWNEYWEIGAHAGHGLYNCVCKTCKNPAKLKMSQLCHNKRCTACVTGEMEVGIIRGVNVYKETFGHWKVVSINNDLFSCQCTKCQHVTELKLSQFFYHAKRCPNCQKPKYVIEVGSTYGNWLVTESADNLFTAECINCKHKEKLTVMQIAYDVCRKKCKCMRKNSKHRDYWCKPNIGEVVGHWRVDSDAGPGHYNCVCTDCGATRIIKGTRVAYPKYTPMCRVCRNVRHNDQRPVQEAERAVEHS